MGKSILLINGSPSGQSGNCARLMHVIRTKLGHGWDVQELHLAHAPPSHNIEESLRRADAYFIVTGTYWDSWGSPLQRFLEEVTPSEGTDLWLGKPAAVAVLMHSVGGKGVLSRLQGVLSTFGALIPPMSGIVYSVTAQLALSARDTELTEDLWRLGDLDIVCHNLLEACAGTLRWRAWPVSRSGLENIWIQT